jgi:antitoxin component of RelBE/YafQ-DinJ toxin-antitoxin module
MRLQPSEHARFKRVAKRMGLAVPDAIRYLMKQADDSHKAKAKPEPWGTDDHR